MWHKLNCKGAYQGLVREVSVTIIIMHRAQPTVNVAIDLYYAQRPLYSGPSSAQTGVNLMVMAMVSCASIKYLAKFGKLARAIKM